MKNVPNILSAIRIFMVPLFIAVYFSQYENSRLYAAIIYAVAAATDVLDGWIARRHNLITNLGRILDPLGDKLMTIAVLSCLTADRIIPPWPIVFFVAKELLMMLGGLFIHNRLREAMPPANILGKTSTFILFLTGLALLVLDMPPETASIIMTFAICIAFMAFGSYVLTFMSVLKNSRDERDQQ